MSTIHLSRADAARAFAAFHFRQAGDLREAFGRLLCVQFDPIKPAGCNHDLVFQARIRDYKVDDWNNLVYQERFAYDGWDKMACLVPFEGWPLRRYYYKLMEERGYARKLGELQEAADRILAEVRERGPLRPSECSVKERRQEWHDHWYGPTVAKQVFRTLWHTGHLMVSARKSGQHVYDLTERVAPAALIGLPHLSEADSRKELIRQRYQTMGLLRPSSPTEIWSMAIYVGPRHEAIRELEAEGAVLPVEIEGLKAFATPEFLTTLDLPSPAAKVTFVAPLDPFMWDRKMIAHLYGFDYIWEIYTPEHKRKWGYYVLPVLYGTDLVARIEFWARGGVLTVRSFQLEHSGPPAGFWPELEVALRRFMAYAGCRKAILPESLAGRVRLSR